MWSVGLTASARRARQPGAILCCPTRTIVIAVGPLTVQVDVASARCSPRVLRLTVDERTA